MSGLARAAKVSFYKSVLALSLGVFALVLVATCTQTANAHPDVIIGCENNLKVNKVTKLGEERVYENGLIGEVYDRNNDGKIDIETLSIPVPGEEPNSAIQHRSFPLFYVVDMDLDGEPDGVYIDKTFQGEPDVKKHCDNVVLYEDLRTKAPGIQGENPKPDYQKKGDI